MAFQRFSKTWAPSQRLLLAADHSVIRPLSPSTIPAVGALLTLCVLAWSDLTRRRLPNRWVGIYAALFLPYAWMHGLSWLQVGIHGLAGAIAFLVLLVFFAARWLGGGDVKLGAAIFLWAGPLMSLPALAITAWSGALLGVLGWLLDRFSPPLSSAPRSTTARVRRALSARRGVPYGLALAFGGAYLIWIRSA